MAYNAALSSLNQFCVSQNIPFFLPVSQQIISLYIAWLYQKNLSYKSVVTYLAGISYFHRLNNWDDPTARFYIKKAMEGYKRQNWHSDTRLPITIDMLNDLCTSLSTVCYSYYESVLFRAMFLVAFFGLFRISELVVVPTLSSDCSLKASDVSFHNRSGIFIAKLILKKSKNNQRGPPQIITMSELQNKRLCPVNALQTYLKTKPSSDSLFCHINSSPVTRFQFTTVLKKCLSYLGISSGRLLSHSFRIGAATYLHSMGISHDIIKKKGRWSSHSYKNYIR